jgi:large conductance mechanosensitive channel
MPDQTLVDVQEDLLEGEQRVVRGARWFYEDFTCTDPLSRGSRLTAWVAFLGRDNVIEVALGLIIGAAFSTLVTSLVADIILPPISLLSTHSRNLESRFLVLRKGQTHKAIYNTIEQAAADGPCPLKVLVR